MQTEFNARVEFEKWTNFDTRLIFTNCGALTWYLRKAWLLDNAPELMPVSQPGESFEIRRTVRTRLAKSDHFSHIRIRARLAFADRLAHLYSLQHTAAGPGFWWRSQVGQRDEVSLNFALPGKPRRLKAVDVGYQWIYLKWKWPKSGVTRLGYRIERSQHRTKGYQTVAVTHTCDLLLLPVSSGVEYYYRVRAFNPAGDGPPSEPIQITAF
jgi:Fibronectin type III domain